jgi:hypothetical protein
MHKYDSKGTFMSKSKGNPKETQGYSEGSQQSLCKFKQQLRQEQQEIAKNVTKNVTNYLFTLSLRYIAANSLNFPFLFPGCSISSFLKLK